MATKRKVVVTGMGAVSPLGVGVEANVAGLMAGRSALAPASFLHTSLTIPIGEVLHSNAELCQFAGIPASGDLSRSYLLGLVAAREALQMAGVDDGSGVMLVTSSTCSGVEVAENCYSDLEGNAAKLPYFHTNQIPYQLAQTLGVNGRQFCNSTACASSANGILLAARLIASGKAHRVLVGGYDAQSRFSLNGFHSLEITSPTGCRPFCRDRNGTSLGEAGAFLVLESEEAARGKKVYGVVTGYANVNEAYHATSSSPDGEGARRAIADCLNRAGVEPAAVDYINAHGTGTKVNDLSESLAIGQIFGNSVPVSSTKGLTGHTLAACGALEAVYSLLAIREQMVWGNCGMEHPLNEVSLNIVRQSVPACVNTVLSNSFGFGGNTSSLLFTKY